jgi:pimeloyl-ACP methyl ester carboxylesterase
MTVAPEPVTLKSFSSNAVIAEGSGAPVVFLHGPLGQEWSGFLDDLAARHRVFAPASPGVDEAADLDLLDGMHDLVIYYDELFDNLGLDVPFDLVGHSYGGMVAAEYAATYPGKVGKLVLIDSMGLWLDDAPVGDFVTVAPETLAELTWLDFDKPEVKERTCASVDLGEARAQMLRRFAAVASAAHFTAPIPERGLSKRLRRVRAQTLLIWGAEDLLVPAVYAEEFRSHIDGARVEIVEGARHYPYVEQREAVSRAVLEFLG